MTSPPQHRTTPAVIAKAAGLWQSMPVAAIVVAHRHRRDLAMAGWAVITCGAALDRRGPLGLAMTR